MKKNPVRPSRLVAPGIRPIVADELRNVTGGTDRDVCTGQSSGKRQHEPL